MFNTLSLNLLKLFWFHFKTNRLSWDRNNNNTTFSTFLIHSSWFLMPVHVLVKLKLYFTNNGGKVHNKHSPFPCFKIETNLFLVWNLWRSYLCLMFVGLLNNYSKKNCFHEPCVQDAVFLRNRYEEASLGSNGIFIS